MSTSQAAVLIEELRSLGVSLSPEGEHLRYRGRGDVITPDLLERIRARKGELLEILRAETPEDLATSGEILQTRAILGAVKIRSRVLDGRQLWLARDERVADELRVEMGSEDALPVLLFSDIPGLAGKSKAMLRAILDTASVFPGSRIVQ